MKEIKAPHFVDNKLKTVFLAGSIEMGAAEQWQTRAVELLKDSGLTIVNPRRDDWDSTWEQKATNPQFREQVTWELQHIEDADAVIIYFDPNTKAPITLLELGFCAGHKNALDIFVVCPEGFYRKGNVDIVCERYGLFTFDTLEGACEAIKEERNF